MNVIGVSFPIDFEQPQWLWLMLLVPVVVAVSLRALVALEPLRRSLAIATRCLQHIQD